VPQTLGELTALPRPLSCISEVFLLKKEKGKEKVEEKKKQEKERKKGNVKKRSKNSGYGVAYFEGCGAKPFLFTYTLYCLNCT